MRCCRRAPHAAGAGLQPRGCWTCPASRPTRSCRCPCRRGRQPEQLAGSPAAVQLFAQRAARTTRLPARSADELPACGGAGGPAGGHPAGARAGRGAAAHAVACPRSTGRPGQPLPGAHRRQPWCCRAPADAARAGRLVVRHAQPEAEQCCCAAGGLRRRLRWTPPSRCLRRRRPGARLGGARPAGLAGRRSRCSGASRRRRRARATACWRRCATTRAEKLAEQATGRHRRTALRPLLHAGQGGRATACRAPSRASGWTGCPPSTTTCAWPWPPPSAGCAGRRPASSR
jgi:hypothetical protein